MSDERRRRRRVCLFGTSADPPTGEGGHLGIVRHLTSMASTSTDDDGEGGGDGPLFDEVRVLPVYSHMFGNKRGRQAPFRARVEMCRLLFKDVPGAVVSEAERTCFERAAEGLDDDQKASLRVGTADLLDMLTSDEPDVDFTMALGADTFVDLAGGKWRRTEDVFRMLGCRMVVFRRLSDGGNGGNESAESSDRAIRESIAMCPHIDETRSSNVRVVRIPALSNVSSSAARGETDEAVLDGMLSRGVLEYIRRHRMYSFSAETHGEN